MYSDPRTHFLQIVGMAFARHHHHHHLQKSGFPKSATVCGWGPLDSLQQHWIGINHHHHHHIIQYEPNPPNLIELL